MKGQFLSRKEYVGSHPYAILCHEIDHIFGFKRKSPIFLAKKSPKNSDHNTGPADAYQSQSTFKGDDSVQ
jgi:hypothetical protein